MDNVFISEEQTDKFCELIYDEVGLVLDKSRYRNRIKWKITQRMKKLDIVGCDDYYDYLWFSEKGSSELKTLVNSCVVNETLFFRYHEQLKLVQRKILRELISRRRNAEVGPLRIFSAGCSTGAEPYSVAIAYLEVCKKYSLDKDDPGIEIIGVDISTKALKEAQEGLYNARVVENAPDYIVDKYFNKIEEGYQLADVVKKLVNFRYLNLTDSMPPRGLDLLFCRNVLIYFDEPVREKVFYNFHKALKDEAFLVLGPSEAIVPYSEYFQSYISSTQIYQKWTTDRRIPSVWGMKTKQQKKLFSKRKSVYKKPLPVITSDEDSDEEIQKIKISGIAAENVPYKGFKELLMKKFIPGQKKYLIDLSKLKYMANAHLRQLILILKEEIKENEVEVVKIITKDKRLQKYFWGKGPWQRIVCSPELSQTGGRGHRVSTSPGDKEEDKLEEKTSKKTKYKKKQEVEETAIDKLLAETVKDTDKKYEIEVKEEDGNYILQLIGRLDNDKDPNLTKILKEEIASLLNLILLNEGQSKKLVIEMNRTKYLSRNLFKLIDRLRKMAEKEDFEVIIECERESLQINLERWGAL